MRSGLEVDRSFTELLWDGKGDPEVRPPTQSLYLVLVGWLLTDVRLNVMIIIYMIKKRAIAIGAHSKFMVPALRPAPMAIAHLLFM